MRSHTRSLYVYPFGDIEQEHAYENPYTKAFSRAKERSIADMPEQIQTRREEITPKISDFPVFEKFHVLENDRQAE